jgi:hypothetical protein
MEFGDTEARHQSEVREIIIMSPKFPNNYYVPEIPPKFPKFPEIPRNSPKFCPLAAGLPHHVTQREERTRRYI